MALKQEEPSLNLVALVSIHPTNSDTNAAKLDGFISTQADSSKKKSNLVLRLFPSHQVPTWLGSLDRLVPDGVYQESKDNLQIEQFPLTNASSKTCSYSDSSCIAWLHTPNLFTEAQKFVRLARKVTPEKRGQVFAEADRIINVASSLSFSQYLST